MQASQIPVKMGVIFAKNAGSPYIRTVPVPSQIGIQNGAASFNDGFPPWCFGAGGAPFGQDFNGLLNVMTAWQQWGQSGAPITYDAAFSATIGGYPAGALLMKAGLPGQFWYSTLDNNLSDPDTGGAGWSSFGYGQFVQVIPITTFYVNPSTGNDSNPGTLALPFLTPQGAVNYIAGYASASQVTINFAAGTYAGFTIPQSQIASWNLVGAGYASTTIAATSTSVNTGRALIVNGATVTIGGLTFTAYYDCIHANYGAQISMSLTTPNAIIGTQLSYSTGLRGSAGGSIVVRMNQTLFVSGSFSYVFGADSDSNLNFGFNDASGTFAPVISFGSTTAAFVVTSISGSNIQCDVGYMSFTGSIPTAQRFSCASGGSITALGGGVNFFPGTSAGVAASSTTITSATGCLAGSYYG